MTDILFDVRRGGGASVELLFGTVTLKPTLAHARATSIVLPAPTTYDLIDGQVVVQNVQPTPAPVDGQIEWALEVTFKDRHGKTFSFLVGVPDSTSQVNFISLPRYFETKPPLFGQGPQGDPGESATVDVGTVSGGAEASVNNSGTNTDAVLDFVLPEGPQGPPGQGVNFEYRGKIFSDPPSAYSNGLHEGLFEATAGGWPRPSGTVFVSVTTFKHSGFPAASFQLISGYQEATMPLFRKALTGETWGELKTLASSDLATTTANGLMSSADKSKLNDLGTLAYDSKLATDAPSTYPEGVSVGLFSVAKGWPVLAGSNPGFVLVRTDRPRGNPSASQWAYAYVTSASGNINSTEVLYRVGSSEGVWGDWQAQVNKDYVTGRRAGVIPDDYGTLQEAFTAAQALKLPIILDKEYVTDSLGSIFWSVTTIGRGSVTVGGSPTFTPEPAHTGIANHIYYDSNTGADTNSGLAKNAPLKSLARVVQLLNLYQNTAMGNITINIAAGTHFDNFRSSGQMGMFRSRLKIRGELSPTGIRLSILDGTGTSNVIGIWIEPGIYCAITDLAIRNFTSTDTSGTDAPDTGAGIVHKGGGDVQITNVHVKNCSQGVGIIDMSKGHVSGSLIENCNTGVRVLYGSSAQIGTKASPNTIRNCTSNGVLLSRNAVAHVDYNNINGCASGVTVQMAARFAMIDGSVTNNTIGVTAEGAGEMIISAGTTFYGNGRDRAYFGVGRETRIHSLAPTTNEWCIGKRNETISYTGGTSRVSLINYGSSIKLPPRHFVSTDNKLRYVTNFNSYGAGTKEVTLWAINPENSSNAYMIGSATIAEADPGEGRLEFNIYGLNSTQCSTVSRVESNNRLVRIVNNGNLTIQTSHQWVFRLSVQNSDSAGVFLHRQSEIHLMG